MKLIDMKIKDFIEVLGSKSPAPGGGSVSALVGANAAALMMMVSELSINKKKFQALDQKIQDEYLEIVKTYAKNKEKFLEYIDEDTEAFNKVMDAYKLPKETEADIELRNLEIEKATVESIKVPMNVCLTAIESLRYLEYMIKYSNKNTLSDQGVAALLFYSAFEGASMNVIINLSGLSEEGLKKDYQKVIAKMSEEAKALKEDLLEKVYYLMK